MNYLYLFLLLFSISYPLYKSFDKRVNYHKNWKNLFLAMLPMLAFMLVWDVAFTRLGIWGFNPTYNLGLSIFYLPIEEWLFFILIPFSSIFIYEVVIYYDPNQKLQKIGKPVNLALILICVTALFFGYQQLYTLVMATSLLVLLLLHQFIFKTTTSYLGRFFVAFIFILIPFIAVNGVLTGSFIVDEVVWYNMSETFGVRMGTIPIEDFGYCMFMLLLTVTFYEKLKKSKN